MTLYDLLSTLKTNAKVTVVNDTETFTVYADSVHALDETIQDKPVKEWELKGGQTLEVILDQIVSG